MKGKSYQEMARFVADNLHRYAKSDVEQAYHICFSYKVSGLLGIHVDSRSGCIYSTGVRNFKINFDAPTADDAANEVKQLMKDKGVIWDDFIVYSSIYGVLDNFRQKDDGKYNYWGTSATDLCQFIMVVNDWEAHDSYALVNPLMEKQNIKYNYGAFVFEYDGVAIKLFQNNRLDFKSMTDKFKKRLDTIFYVHQQITHRGRDGMFVKQ